MGLGSILGSISPLFGIASGKGIFGNKDVLGSLSPIYGMASGHGLFGGGLGGLLGGGLGGGQKNPGFIDGQVPSMNPSVGLPSMGGDSNGLLSILMKLGLLQ